MAIISKGITLSYKLNLDDEYIPLNNLLEIPELGTGERDSIEVTTLQDDAHVFTEGLLNYGDSLSFKFLYEIGQFEEFVGIANSSEFRDVHWELKLPDSTVCDFRGSCSVKLDGVGASAALTYTLTIKPSSAMNWSF